MPTRGTSGKLNLALDWIGARRPTNDISAECQNEKHCNNHPHNRLATGETFAKATSALRPHAGPGRLPRGPTFSPDLCCPSPHPMLP